MSRILLTAVALAAILPAGAIAQESTTSAPPPPAANAATTTSPTGHSILATGYTVTDKDNLATEIIGKQVYSSTAADAEHIGDVSNLVIGADGQVAAVIIGVGGFLGIGTKDVAVNYSELQWATADDGSKRFVLPTTKDALKAAPDFKTIDKSAANTAAPTVGQGDQTATGQAAAPKGANAVAAPINRDKLTSAPLTANNLKGTNAYGPGDEHLGTIGDVVLTRDGKSVQAVIIDFGGFLGIGAKPVAVSVENLRFAMDANGHKYLFINVTRDQLDKAKTYNKDTYASEPDQELRTSQQ